MKISCVNLLFIIITIAILIIQINSHTIFPGPKSEQEKACNKKSNPSVETCRAVEAADNQEACCLVTYTNKETGEKYQKCGYLENTEYGIKVFKNIYAEYKEVKIQCKSNYIEGFLLINLFIILLFI